jgi:uncharacterized integral membrane protein
MAAGSVVILWFAGHSGGLTWPLAAALLHPVWLLVGEVLGAVAWAITAATLSVLGVRRGGPSVLVALGVVGLVGSIPGVALVLGLDLAFVSRAQDDVTQAIFFAQRWDWWSGVGWVLFAIGGSLGLVFLGVGLARGNRVLRYPGMALAGSLVAMYLFVPAAILLAASLCWLAIAVARADSNPLSGTPQPAR